MRQIILILLASLSTALSGTITNHGLVAIGRVPADMLDVTGKDTLGGFFSAMTVAPGSWTFSSNVCNGTLYGLPDRGFGDGTTDYRPRIQTFRCVIDLATHRVTLTNTATTLLTRMDGSNFTGLANPPAGVGRLDPEGFACLPGGDFLVAEENGPAVHRFGPDGRMKGSLAVPKIYERRRDNRGFEGLTLSTDGQRAVAMLQSPLLSDEGASADSLNTRIIVFKGSEVVSEHVYQLTMNGNAKHTKHTPVSEILAVSDHQYLVIERDSGGLGGENPALYKRIVLVDTAGATDILRTPYHEQLPKSELPADLKPVGKTDFIDLLQAGLRPEEVPEKWEGLALLPVPGTKDVLLLVGTDNDFKSSTVIHNGREVGKNAITVDTLILVYRLTLP